MAYSRWGSGSDWYVFWVNTISAASAAARPELKSNEHLAIWHSDSNETASFTYAEICQMLITDDLLQIPGYNEDSKAVLRGYMAEFVQDVDIQYAS